MNDLNSLCWLKKKEREKNNGILYWTYEIIVNELFFSFFNDVTFPPICWRYQYFLDIGMLPKSLYSMLSSYCTERYYKNIYLMKALVRDAVHKKKSYIGTRRRKIKSVKKIDQRSNFSF